MNLYFMRHGIAVNRADQGVGSDDRKRSLTPKGIKECRAAKGLMPYRSARPNPHQVPWNARARQRRSSRKPCTWGRQEEIQELCPDQSVQDLLSALAAYSDKDNILLIGHEPLLSSTVSFLLSGSAGAEIRLKKGGLCCLEVDRFPPKESAVHWALAPSSYGKWRVD
jgi:phosphohistidine phosphatase